MVTQKQEHFRGGHFSCRFDYSSKNQRGGNHEPVDSILQESPGKEAHEGPDQSVVIVRKGRGRVGYSPIPGETINRCPAEPKSATRLQGRPHAKHGMAAREAGSIRLAPNPGAKAVQKF